MYMYAVKVYLPLSSTGTSSGGLFCKNFASLIRDPSSLTKESSSKAASAMLKAISSIDLQVIQYRANCRPTLPTPASGHTIVIPVLMVLLPGDLSPVFYLLRLTLDIYVDVDLSYVVLWPRVPTPLGR